MGNLIASHILTIITFTPAVGALLILFFNRTQARAIRTFALIVTILAFLFSLYLPAKFESGDPDFQFRLDVPWMPTLGVDYSMTTSCYDPNDGRACGRCDACQLRRKGFADAGISDPTAYA